MLSQHTCAPLLLLRADGSTTPATPEGNASAFSCRLLRQASSSGFSFRLLPHRLVKATEQLSALYMTAKRKSAVGFDCIR